MSRWWPWVRRVVAETVEAGLRESRLLAAQLGCDRRVVELELRVAQLERRAELAEKVLADTYKRSGPRPAT